MSNLKPIVNQEHLWNALLEEFNRRLAIQQVNLESAEDIKDVYRIQGQIKALKSLLSLREHTNGKR